jgi:hypothetical protein
MCLGPIIAPGEEGLQNAETFSQGEIVGRPFLKMQRFQMPFLDLLYPDAEGMPICAYPPTN